MTVVASNNQHGSASPVHRLASPLCPPAETAASRTRQSGDARAALRSRVSHPPSTSGSTEFVRGLFSAKVPNSSFAEVHVGLLTEPTHMEDEDEDQENEKEDERDGEECRVESRRVPR